MISFYTSEGILKSFFYDLSILDDRYNITFNVNFVSYQCKKNYFGLNVYYYRQKEEFVNSCIDLNGNILAEFYDKNYNIYDYYISQKTVYNNIYSILYSNCTQKYFLISEKQNFVLLDGDKEELEEIKNNFDIDNCINIKEEEKQENSYNQNSYEDLTEKYDNNPIIEKYIYQNSINNLLNDIQKGVLNTEINNLINKEYETEDYIQKDNDIIMQITTPYNQINKIYDNISTIYIECQEILKEKYNLTKKNSFLIFKYEYYIPKLNIPLIGYDILHPITKEKLDLQYCNDAKVNVNIPVLIDESNLEKYNPESDYYNNICRPCTNEKGLDLTIFDRKKQYNTYNMSICPKNCIYNDYNNYTKKVTCECEIQTKKSSLLLEDIVDMNKLLNNFVDIKSISNVEIAKCYNEAFAKLKSTLLSYIILVIILIFLISIILFFILEYKLLFKRIDNIEDLVKQENSTIKDEINNNTCNITKKKIKKKRKDKICPFDSNKPSLSGTIDIKLIKSKELIINNINNPTINNDTNNNFIYNDYEINSFPYKEALEKDKRNSCQFYISLIKTKNLLIFSFYPVKNDYNSRIIKICLFFFSFALLLFLNSLFYNDATMHKIYEDEGVFNLLYLQPQIIYSTIISSIINILIKFLALSEKSIIALKRGKNINEFKSKMPTVKKCLTIKFISYFISSIVLLLIV